MNHVDSLVCCCSERKAGKEVLVELKVMWSLYILSVKDEMLSSAVTVSSNGPHRKLGKRLNSETHLSLPSFDSLDRIGFFEDSPKSGILKRQRPNYNVGKSGLR